MSDVSRDFHLVVADLREAALDVLGAAKKVRGRARLSLALDRLHEACRTAEPLLGFANPFDHLFDETDEQEAARRVRLRKEADEYCRWFERVERERAAAWAGGRR